MQMLNDFVRGEEDCKSGVPHKPDQSPEIVDVIKHKNKYSTQTFIVLDEMPKFEFERVGSFLVGHNSGFYYFYEYSKSTQAFAGREFDIPLIGGGVEKASGQWWHSMPKDYQDLVYPLAAGSPESLGRCNVFSSIYVDCEILNKWLCGNNPSNNYHKYDARHKNFGIHTIVSAWAGG